MLIFELKRYAIGPIIHKIQGNTKTRVDRNLTAPKTSPFFDPLKHLLFWHFLSGKGDEIGMFWHEWVRMQSLPRMFDMCSPAFEP